jgi:hypothetical protein
MATEADICAWLGTNGCILMIDELNNLMPSEKVDVPLMTNVARFLRENFLKGSNRYFIFS